MIGTRSQQIFNVRSTPPNFCGCPLTFFGVLRCHTRTSWQCLGLCNLFYYTIVRRPSVRPSVCLWSVKIASPPSQMVGSSPNLHTVLPRSVRIHDVLKVKVTIYGQLCCSTKIAPGRSQMDGSSLI